MSALAQMKLLINLAQIDGYVADRERNYIRNIATANGVDPQEIEPLFDSRHELLVPADLAEEDKFNYIISLVQLMKIDERMYREEMLFCSTVAAQLGYDKDVMFDLLLQVKGAAMKNDEMESLRETLRKYLK